MPGATQDIVDYYLSTMLPHLDKTQLKTVQQESANSDFKCKYDIHADYVSMIDKKEQKENEYEVEFDMGNGSELEVELEHELALEQHPVPNMPNPHSVPGMIELEQVPVPNMPNPFSVPGMIELDQIPMTTTDPIILDMDNPFAY